MRNLLRYFFAAWLLLAVALVSALTAMRLAIHVREVRVPDFRGRRPAEARLLAEQSGLGVQAGTSYYSSTVPEGRVLSQGPAPGAVVRRGFEVQLALSLGPQRISIPQLIGESSRAAAITIANRGLELSATDNVQLPGAASGQVVGQNPGANSTDISAPRISLLVTGEPAPQAFVMPSFLGQPLGAAGAVIENAGFSVGKLKRAAPPLSPGAIQAPEEAPNSRPALPGPGTPPETGETAPSAPSPASIVVSQDPAPGYKVLAGAAVNFVVK
ncbi:MAG: PASTA domain-containing protein [Acidobacteria bacterium]|nr:PASTA domain-containing protein [Acidobacteriota bacterium]